MTFTKRLRDGVRRGEVTCSVRIWTRPHVKVGGRYRMEEGEIEVDSIEPIGLPDITPVLARESGFLGVVDLLKVANHGRGRNIYLVRFSLFAPARQTTTMMSTASRQCAIEGFGLVAVSSIVETDRRGEESGA
jgi:hypothetical protein